METKILQILKNTKDDVAEEKLCEGLEVSKTVVWKLESEIASRLQTNWAGRELHCYEVIDSTNNIAKQFAQRSVHGAVFLAEKQEAGKGRRGRSWISPSGTGIWLSLLLKPEIKPTQASMLTLVAALSMSRAIETVTGLKTEIKWPNDIVINKKKVCGILTEMSAEIELIHYVVVGLGVNVNIEEFPQELKEKATSLKLELGKSIERASLICVFLSYFEQDYEIFMQKRNLSGLLKDYNQRLVNRNCEVRVLDPNGEYMGIAISVEENGGLIVKKEGGEYVTITSGEVSVRGIYGYV